ncbi:MAG TPA: hypothetical protein VMV49_06745 [Candidatus Deferrimicrobium sp.]|nr:hypothetical protein [Candidatus Deferrimicrobium sp.]
MLSYRKRKLLKKEGVICKIFFYVCGVFISKFLQVMGRFMPKKKIVDREQADAQIKSNGLGIEISDERIQISEADQVIVCWSCDEWTEDSSVVPAIANAIFLALTNPDKLKTTLFLQN